MKYLLVIFCICTLTTANAQPTEEFYNFELREVKKGIRYSYRPEPLREQVEGNFVFIETKKYIVVVDATGSPEAARTAIKSLRSISKKPVKYLINTHFHGDHTFGNQEFVKSFPDIKIVASRPTAEVITKRVETFKAYTNNDSLFRAKLTAIDKDIDRVKESQHADARVIKNLERHRDRDMFTVRRAYSEIKITPPTTIVDDRLDLGDAARPIQAIYLGKGDTPGDLWVYLPIDKILISGDALVYPIPYGFSKEPLTWLETLKKARELDFEVLIPGHGEALQDKSHLDLLIKTITELERQIRDLIGQGKTVDQIPALLQLSETEKDFTKGDLFLRHYLYDYFITPITKGIFDQLKRETK